MTKYIYTDINLSLLRHPTTSDVVKRYDVEAVKGAVRNVLTTAKGEKLFKPEFGADLNRLLFEMMTPATKLLARRQIIEEIQRWEPRVVVTDVNISTADEYTLTVKVDFYVQATQTQSSVTVNLERIR